MAAWHLQGEAANWWEIVIEETGEDNITWAEFKRKFEGKFFSGAEQGRPLEQFIALKQGGLSIKEYVNKFNELARFGFDLVNTSEKKA